MRPLALFAILSVSAPAMAVDPPAALRAAVAAHESGDVTTEGNELVAVLADPRHSTVHGTAWTMYGDLLASSELREAAVIAYGKALETNPRTLSTHLETALHLADATGDTAVLGQAGLVGDLSTLGDTPERARLAVLAARAAIAAGDFDTAVALTDLVSGSDPAFVDARIVRGVAQANQTAYGDALASLLIANAAVPPGDTETADLVKINLARTYYAAENPLKAIEHYVQVSRGGEHWIQAHWERAWAHFVVDDMPGTLSLLRAYQTPYLADTYMAEGDMLRIYALFLMCKFPTATVELDAFQGRYRPLLSELDRAMVDLDTNGAWADLQAWGHGDPTDLPVEVFQRFENDDRTTDALKASAIGSAERIAAVALGPWGETAATLLDERHAFLAASEGERVLARARQMQAELREWLGNADLTRLDIMEYERKLLERAAITGEMDLGDRLGELRGLRKRRGTRVWPSSEEVWADEVGYESVRTRSDCREDML